MTKDKMYYIKRWMPFIRKMSRKFKNIVASQEDLESEGILGVLKALDTHVPGRSSLDSFCYQCINTAIKVAAIENAYPVHYPAGTFLVNKSSRERNNAALSGSISLENGENISLATTDEFEEYIAVIDLIEKYDDSGMAKLYFLDGLTCKEVAEKMGISCSTTWKTLSAIRENLRDEMGGIK